MVLHILQDALFSAIAAIGFAAISRPPKQAYIYCALTAALGHSLRFVLMQEPVDMNILFATLLGSLVVGLLAVFFAGYAKFPAETCLFPALLPMIPGMYAYRTFGGLGLSLLADSQEQFDRYFYLFSYNGIMTVTILLCMVVGATLPIFILKKIAFQATR